MMKPLTPTMRRTRSQSSTAYFSTLSEGESHLPTLEVSPFRRKSCNKVISCPKVYNIGQKRHFPDDVTPVILNLCFPYHIIREEYAFPTLPKLPSINESNFAKIFVDKINICSKLCDYTIQDFEKNAKIIKLHTLREFAEFSMNHICNMKYVVDLFEMVSTNIFRKIPPYPALYENISTDFSAMDLSWEHVKLCYLILIRILPQIPTIDSIFINRIVSRLYTPLTVEQDQITSFLSVCITEFAYTRKFIRSELLKTLVEYYDLHRYPFSIAPALTLISRHFSELKITSQDFLVYIAPLVSAPHLKFFSNQFQKVASVVLSNNQNSGFQIFDKIVKFWPKTNIEKQACAVRIIIDICELLPPDQFKQTVSKLSQIFNDAVSSPNSDVAEQCLIIWDRQKLLSNIQSDNYSLIPLIINSLINTYYTHWSASVQNSASAALKILSEFCPNVVRKCMRQQTKISVDANEYYHSSWIKIAKKAGEHDMNMDIFSKLENINNAFPPETILFRRNFSFSPEH